MINVSIENVDEKQRLLGVKFVDTDMRMQRLGIEKNLAYRLQKKNFWEQYGQTIMNVIFYVLITMLLIVLFVQWKNTGEVLNKAVETAGEVLKEVEKRLKGILYTPKELITQNL